MGKKTGKVPVTEPMGARLMDRQPLRQLGDSWARNLSEEEMMKHAGRSGMSDVWMTVMNKAVLHDAAGNEINPSQMRDSVPYRISPQNSDKNIGWIMRKGVAGVGRIYNENIDSYDAIQNDPDRPDVFDGIPFEGADMSELGLSDSMATRRDDNDGFRDRDLPDLDVQQEQAESTQMDL